MCWICVHLKVEAGEWFKRAFEHSKRDGGERLTGDELADICLAYEEIEPLDDAQRLIVQLVILEAIDGVRAERANMN